MKRLTKRFIKNDVLVVLTILGLATAGFYYYKSVRKTDTVKPLEVQPLAECRRYFEPVRNTERMKESLKKHNMTFDEAVESVCLIMIRDGSWDELMKVKIADATPKKYYV